MNAPTTGASVDAYTEAEKERQRVASLTQHIRPVSKYTPLDNVYVKRERNKINRRRKKSKHEKASRRANR